MKLFFYRKDKGDIPVEKFLSSLQPKLLAKTLRTIDLLEQNGNQLREPYSKYLEKGLFELRIKQSTDISRILYFFYSDKKIIMTNGFIKKSQKTPRSQIALAMKYKEDYERRNLEYEI